MKKGIDHKGMTLRLDGDFASFGIEKHVDGVRLTITSPESTLAIPMTHGQYDALASAIKEVKDSDRDIISAECGAR